MTTAVGNRCHTDPAQLARPREPIRIEALDVVPHRVSIRRRRLPHLRVRLDVRGPQPEHVRRLGVAAGERIGRVLNLGESGWTRRRVRRVTVR